MAGEAGIGRRPETAYLVLRQMMDICRGCATQQEARQKLEEAGLWHDFIPKLRFYRNISDKA